MSRDAKLQLPGDTLPIEELRSLWHKHFGTPPSITFTRRLLARAVAWKMQVDAHGDISASTRLEMQKIVDHLRANKRVDGGSTAALPMPPATLLKPGAQLVRVWRGVTHTVSVTADGFEWNGNIYPSLSAIAKAITGTQWNGLVYFGLRARPARRASLPKKGARPPASAGRTKEEAKSA